jgi:hypothetical protein
LCGCDPLVDGCLSYAIAVNMKMIRTSGKEDSSVIESSAPVVGKRARADPVGLLAMDRKVHMNVLAYLQPNWVRRERGADDGDIARRYFGGRGMFTSGVQNTLSDEFRHEPLPMDTSTLKSVRRYAVEEEAIVYIVTVVPDGSHEVSVWYPWHHGRGRVREEVQRKLLRDDILQTKVLQWLENPVNRTQYAAEGLSATETHEQQMGCAECIKKELATAGITMGVEDVHVQIKKALGNQDVVILLCHPSNLPGGSTWHRVRWTTPLASSLNRDEPFSFPHWNHENHRSMIPAALPMDNVAGADHWPVRQWAPFPLPGVIDACVRLAFALHADQLNPVLLSHPVAAREPSAVVACTAGRYEEIAVPVLGRPVGKGSCLVCHAYPMETQHIPCKVDCVNGLREIHCDHGTMARYCIRERQDYMSKQTEKRNKRNLRNSKKDNQCLYHAGYRRYGDDGAARVGQWNCKTASCAQYTRWDELSPMVQHAFEFILATERQAYIKNALATDTTDSAVATAAKLAVHNAYAIRAVVPAFDRRNINAMSVFMDAIRAYADAACGADDVPSVALHLGCVLQLVELVRAWHDQLAAADKAEQVRVSTRTLIATGEMEAQIQETKTQKALVDSQAIAQAKASEEMKLLRDSATRDLAAAEEEATTFRRTIADLASELDKLKEANAVAVREYDQRIAAKGVELEGVREAMNVAVQEHDQGIAAKGRELDGARGAMAESDGIRKVAVLQEELKAIELESASGTVDSLQWQLERQEQKYNSLQDALTHAQTRIQYLESTATRMEAMRGRDQQIIQDKERLLVDCEDDFLVTTFAMCLVDLRETQCLKYATVQTHVESATGTDEKFPWASMVVGASVRGRWEQWYTALAPTATPQSVLTLFIALRNNWAHNGRKVIRDMLTQWPRVFVYMQKVVDCVIRIVPGIRTTPGWTSWLMAGDFSSSDGKDLVRFRDIVAARASRDWLRIDGFSRDLSVPLDLSGD